MLEGHVETRKTKQQILKNIYVAPQRYDQTIAKFIRICWFVICKRVKFQKHYISNRKSISNIPHEPTIHTRKMYGIDAYKKKQKPHEVHQCKQRLKQMMDVPSLTFCQNNETNWTPGKQIACHSNTTTLSNLQIIVKHQNKTLTQISS